MALEDSDVTILSALLSAERLSALVKLTGSARAAIELHQSTLRLGAALMHITGTIEIALRNSVCENLSAHFGTPRWLLSPPAPFRWREPERAKVKGALDSARRAEYAKLTQAQKTALDLQAFPNGRPANLSHRDKVTTRRNTIVVTDGKVIAELTLYFWKRLFSADYEQSLWRTTLKRTFPYKKINRADIADHLETIYQTRNRLAHHEPVLHKRFQNTINSITYISGALGVKVPDASTPLAKLIHADLEETKIKAMDLHKKLDAYRIGK